MQEIYQMRLKISVISVNYYKSYNTDYRYLDNFEINEIDLFA